MSRSLIVVVAVLGLFGASGEAHAQGGAFGGPVDGLGIAFGIVDGSFAAAAVLTGVRSTMHVASGTRSAPWFIASAVTGTFNLGIGVAAIAASRVPHLPGLAFYPAYVAVGVGHLIIGLWNVVISTIGFIRGTPSGPAVTPVVIGGHGPSGSRWTGLGIQVTNF